MQTSLAKKAFAVGLAASTLVWAAAPFVAFAAAHAAGTNVKSSDGTVWMITTAGQRRAYTSAGAFLSYGFNSFASVLDANTDDLALPVGSFIPPQDGKVICSDRGSDKGTCYLITGAQKGGFTSAAVFTGLGFSFARATSGDVSWMSSTSNIDNTTAAHRAGVLVNNGGTVQLVGSNGLLGIPDLATFNSWGYSFADVVPANSADKTSTQTGVMASRTPGQLSPVATTTPPPATPPVTPPPGTPPPAVSGTVTAALASDNPAASVLAGGSSYNSLLKFTLTNGNSSAVNVTQMTVSRGGIVQDSNVAGVGIFDPTGHRHGNFGTFGTAKSTIGFPSDPIVIPANGSTTVTIKVNLNTGITTGTISVNIAQAADIVTNATSVGGTFPITGNAFNIVSGTNVIASATLNSQAQGGGTSTSPLQVDLGITNYPVQKFRIAESSGQEDLKVASILVFNNGTAADGDYTNITLKDQNGTVLSTQAKALAGKVQFTMSPAYVIPRGATRDFTIYVDIPGTPNSASRTLDFTVQNDYDVELYGSQTFSGVLPTAAGSATFPIGDGSGADVANFIQFKQGSVTVSKGSDSPSAKLAPGTTNAVLASFDAKAFGEDIELQKITFLVTSDGTSGVANGARALTGTVKVNDENGATLYSTTSTTGTLYYDSGASVSGNTLTSGTGTNGTQVTLNTYKTIKGGTTSKLVFVSDIATTATSTDQYTIAIKGFYARRVSSNNFITNTSQVNGNTRQVDTTSLSVSSNSAYSPTNLVKGGSGLKIGSFNIQAGPAESITLTSLGLIIGTDTTGSTTVVYGSTAVPTGVSNITLKIAGTSFGTPVSSTTAGSTETFSSNATVPASGTVTVDVFADVSNAFDPNAGAGADIVSSQLSVVAAVGQSSQTTVTASGVAGQNVTMTGSGTMLLQSDATDTPIQQVVRGSQTGVTLLALKVSENSNAENLTLNKLYFAATNGSADFSNMSLWANVNGTLTQLGQSATIVSGEIRFTNLNFAVVKGASPVVMWLKGDSTSSGTQVVGQQSFFAPTRYEYQGVSSGVTTRVSGGVTSATSSASTTLTVNDSSQFTVNHKVAIDLDNNGVITTSAETNTNAGYTISAIPTATTLTLSAAVTVTVAGGRVIALDNGSTGASVGTNVNFQSNAMINHNSEPVVATDLSASTGSNGSANQPIATFNISAGGTRDVIINALQVKTSGSYVAPATNYTANSATCTTSGFITVNQKTGAPSDAYQVVVATGNTASDTVTVKSGGGTVTLETFTAVNTTSKTAIIALSSSYVTIVDGSTTCAGGVPAGTITLATSSTNGGLFDMQLWQNGQQKTVTFFVQNSGAVDLKSNAPTVRVASGGVVTLLLSSPITVSAGSSTPTAFVIKANTSATRAGLTTSGTISYSVYLDGQQGLGQWLGNSAARDTTKTLGGVRWDYSDVNGKFGSTGTTTAGTLTTTTSGQATILDVSSGNQVMDVTDYYPVNGPVINY